MRTGNWRNNTPGLRLVGENERPDVLSDCGPVRAGLITSQVINREAALSESLRSWERNLLILESRYSEVLDILEKDILPRVERILSSLTEDITREEDKEL